MIDKKFEHSIWHKFDFIPGLTFIMSLFAMVAILPSSNKIPGYIFLTVLLVFVATLYIREKIKIAKNIVINNKCIVATNFFGGEVKIDYSNIKELNYSGRGLFLMSGKFQKFLYVEIISSQGEKLYIRRDINGFDEITKVIEDKTGKAFTE